MWCGRAFGARGVAPEMCVAAMPVAAVTATLLLKLGPYSRLSSSTMWDSRYVLPWGGIARGGGEGEKVGAGDRGVGGACVGFGDRACIHEHVLCVRLRAYVWAEVCVTLCVCQDMPMDAHAHCVIAFVCVTWVGNGVEES